MYRFTDEEYQRFKQVVVLACNKRPKYAPPKKEHIDAIVACANPATPIDELPVGKGEFVIPPTPVGKVNFVFTPFDPGQLPQLGQQCSPIGTPDYQHATYVRPVGAPFTPAMPLSIGHISMMIAGQETGVLSLPDGSNTILVKGMSRKVIDVGTNDLANDKGQYTHTTVNEREKHIAAITLAHKDGELQMMQSASEVAAFVTKYADPIAEAILKRNKPLYNFDPASAEWNIVAQSALGLPPLPGRSEKGLFDVQKHFSVAAARVMKAHRHCILNAEMGWGKSATSVAILELVDEWPALFMVPGHMLFKWQRELTFASNPEDPIVARVITRPVLSEPPAWLSNIKPAIEAAGGVILETTRFQVQPVTPNDPGGRRKVVFDHTKMELADLDRLTKKLSFKDPEDKRTIPCEIKYEKVNVTLTFVDRDEYTLFDFHADYLAGRLGRKTAAIIAFDPAKYDAGANDEPAMQYLWRRTTDPETGLRKLLKVAICPTCGEVVDIREKYCQHCHAPIFNFNRWRRVGLARLVQKKLKHFFKVYVGDEIHKCQNGRSDIGAADQRILSSVKYSLALTGTLFGGTAGSLFYLLYRRVPELRRLFEFSEKVRWVDHFGV